MSAEPPIDTSNASDRQRDQDPRGLPSGGLAAGPLCGTLFALAGGVLVWAVLQAVHPLFTLPEELADAAAMPSAEEADKIAVAQVEADLYNRILVLGLLGAAIGGSLGIGEGVARRSVKTSLLAAGGCTLIAALFGGLAGLMGHHVFMTIESPVQGTSLAEQVRVHSVVLGTLGAGVGLALGPLAGRIRTGVVCLVAGLLSGVLSALLYPVLTVFLMPAAQTQFLVPLGGTDRLLWMALTAVLLGLIIPAMARPRTSRRDGPPDHRDLRSPA